MEDNDNRKDIAPLVKFMSSHDVKNRTTFGEYVSRMKEGQEAIYFVSGVSGPLCAFCVCLGHVARELSCVCGGVRVRVQN